ncbi:hypothetical protein A1O7_05821 [Cladophialophora yegresii CBS 114405]|uniref:Endoplasmic reticulum junction formation protein lunapark n=1 Tax=Cladophialophora yegresii CBS 114405 TaxID=1182544 RepID=W9W1L7_9EURO|nr:uncharacterized protein A1O7_05821 [Cladophialophora yegresii CBS 114405]EXJ58396.1 hypothetical protein A1O7_05821 [Cladophialophora yegresii CBS 114405]
MSWLWKGDANSPASFEKALSKLASQISAANLALDTSRSRGRRVKALWTLYTTLTYLLYTLLVVLVLGPQNWNPYHYAGLVGAPVLIYGIRKLIAALFDWRAGRQQAYLEHLQKQREQKIADLKKATKYDSTEELLRKYGGAPPSKTPSRQPQQGTKRKVNTPSDQPPQQRTGIAPPPTANIPGRNMPTPLPHQSNGKTSRPSTPPTPNTSSVMVDAMATSPTHITPDSPGFAPNAFSEIPPQTSTTYQQTPHWYDRILDVLLGEDETAAKNRLVLLCSRCRLVNGQAPPGIRSPEELGRWRCSGCGAWNGVENEGMKVVKEITGASKPDSGEGWEKVPGPSEIQEEPTDEVPAGVEGTTGLERADGRGMTKRVTRSAGRKSSFESLE